MKRLWRRRHAKLRRAWRRMPANLRGALYILIASVAFAASGTLVKLAGQTLPTAVIVFFRSLFGLVAVLPFLLRTGPGVLRTAKPWLHLSRGLIGVCAMAAGFYSVTHLPLAQASAISYARPLFVVIIGAVLLKEIVGWRRWAATLTGFGGVLISIGPELLGFSAGSAFAALIGLTSAGLVALVAALVKTMTHTERPLTILIWFGVISTIASLGPALWLWQMPNVWEFLILIGIGALSAGAQGWAIKAYEVADASAVAAFDYSRILFAASFGFLVFAEIPTAWTWAGVGIIVASSLILARAEARR